MNRHPAAPAPAQEFVRKWRTRWPEWGIAEGFVPPVQRALAAAWFALVQELTHTAWALEPAPGLAKLGWWQDELNGWARGIRRHPLGELLRAQPLPWPELATALNGLLVSRETIHRHAAADLRPLARAIMACEARLFTAEPAPAGDFRPTLSDLLAEHALLHADAEAATRVLAARPAPAGAALPRRVYASVLTGRLRQLQRGRREQPPPAWRSLISAWRAARMRS